MQPIFYQPVMAQPMAGQSVMNRLNPPRLSLNVTTTTTTGPSVGLQAKPVDSMASHTVSVLSYSFKCKLDLQVFLVVIVRLFCRLGVRRI